MSFTPDIPEPLRSLDELRQDYENITSEVAALEERCTKLRESAQKTEVMRAQLLQRYAKVSLDLMRHNR